MFFVFVSIHFCRGIKEKKREEKTNVTFAGTFEFSDKKVQFGIIIALNYCLILFVEQTY